MTMMVSMVRQRFAGDFVMTPSFVAYGDPALKQRLERDVQPVVAYLNHRLVVRADHVAGADTVDLYLYKGFREFRPVQRSLDKPPKPFPAANDLPFLFTAPALVKPGTSFCGQWLANRRANQANDANRQTVITNVLAKARYLSNWEKKNHLVGIPGLLVI